MPSRTYRLAFADGARVVKGAGQGCVDTRGFVARHVPGRDAACQTCSSISRSRWSRPAGAQEGLDDGARRRGSGGGAAVKRALVARARARKGVLANRVSSNVEQASVPRSRHGSGRGVNRQSLHAPQRRGACRFRRSRLLPVRVTLSSVVGNRHLFQPTVEHAVRMRPTIIGQEFG